MTTRNEAVLGISVGTLLDGRYLLEEVLATGGMGAVFRGRDRVLDRPVAVKTLHPHLASTPHAGRFIHEGETLAALGHPNLVAVYDSGMVDGLPYLVMEYIEGESLASIMAREGPMRPEEGMPLAVDICRGLGYAHAQGVVHRDIKPQNLLVTPSGQVKIVDFGIARGRESAEMTEPGSVMGTAHYLAPEVAAGEPSTARSDLYSLGVVLYRLFTGQLPFEGENPVTVAVMHRTAPVPRPSTVQPAISPQLEATLLRLLAKDPLRRYANAAAVAAALGGAADEGADPALDENTTLLAAGAPLIPAMVGGEQVATAGSGLRKSDVILGVIAVASALLILFRLVAPTGAESEPLGDSAGPPPASAAAAAAGNDAAGVAPPAPPGRPQPSGAGGRNDQKSSKRGRD